MLRVMECVPNISEGRDPAVVDAVADTVRGRAGVVLMDCSSDPDHNRSVISFMGEPEAVADAAVALACKAAGLIDLTKHTGAHPRMGAVDVIPFIPIRGIDMDECVKLSRRAAAEIYERCGVPSYLYERSATAPHCTNLADIRRAGFEGMAEQMKRPGWEPDYGTAPHPTAGVVAIGARSPLVAFNMNLDTDDVSVAKAIAKTIRESGGGWKNVKALGIFLKSRNTAQVSVNMTDCGVTPLYRVLETVRFEARRWGVSVIGTELIGLSPMSALIDSAAYYLQLEGFIGGAQVIENHLLDFSD